MRIHEYHTKKTNLNPSSRERLKDEEMEKRFTQLALAFAIDSKTITERCERQKRYRDQTERNLNSEIEILVQKVSKIQPLCIDAEKTELLTSVLSQIDIMEKAAFHGSISAERFGAVLQEERLSESVCLMVNYVGLLKKQRDAARRHLQMTKRVLQETQSADNLNAKKTVQNGKLLTKRRASIHTIVQNNEVTPVNKEVSRKITRRPSDLLIFKTSATNRSTKPFRLELGVDLTKIKEGIAENGYNTTQINGAELSTTSDEAISEITGDDLEQISDCTGDTSKSTDRFFRVFYKRLLKKISELSNSGVLHEMFLIGTILCFSLSIITFGNILIELEYAKRNVTPRYTYLGTFWSDMLVLLTNNRNDDSKNS